MREPEMNERRAFWAGKGVVVTGGAGFIGSRVVAGLTKARGVNRSDITVPRSADCDLRDFGNCTRALKGANVVIHLAAVTGGIGFSRSFPASQYRDSSLIDMNVIEAARQGGVSKLVAIGNLFAYAADAPMPLKEETLFDGLPTDAHRGVGWLKRNLALLADLYFRQYRFPMVTVYSANAYGPGDSVDPAHAHVIPATIMKCLEAPAELVVWGDGTPTRDFLYVDDLAEGLIRAAERLEAPSSMNLGSGTEITVRRLVELVARFAGFKGKIVFDVTKSGGDARRCSSVDRARDLLDFKPAVPIEDGLEATVEWYRKALGSGSRG
ncbi:MAG: NAD-dependent epimerase/dehydratase family protein [Acidobacteria bacterium]|nr:MAG: NAD-dependent epimerase/dehydratase family protein [Acidobacteriota bacterium]